MRRSRSLWWLALAGCAGDAGSWQAMSESAAPPPSSIGLTVTPLVVGEEVTFTVTQAQPLSTVHLFRARAVQPGGFCPAPLSPVCMDLQGPVTRMFSMTTDAQGRARATLRLPAITVEQAAFQVAAAGGHTSNAVELPVVQDLTWDPTGAPPVDEPVVLTCSGTIPAASSGVCDVLPGVGAATLLRGTVLTPTAVYEGGQVLIDATGEISCVGCDCSGTPGWADADVVSCAEGVISPGLINAHEHITFSESPPLPQGSTRYQHRHDWRGSLSTPSNPHGTGATSTGTRWVEARQLLAGTTTMIGSGGANGMVRNPDRSLNEGIALPAVSAETFPLGDANEVFRPSCTWSYSLTEREAEAEPSVVAHVAEGIGDYGEEEFTCLSSSFGGGQDLTQPNVSHVHGVALDAGDYWKMARDRAELVWSPRSNLSLYGMTADVRLLHTVGGVIGLGTDWSYSGSANMLRELACADEWNSTYLDGYFSDAELWRMATVNNAVAIEAAQVIGSLVPGLVADIVVFDGRVRERHRAVLGADSGDVALVLRGGVPLFGEADTLASLGASCESLVVCGDARSVCATAEWGGATFASVQAAATGALSAAICGAPVGEPTCLPSRPGEYSGAITGTDPDGDGLIGGADACPTVFNPVRPMDGGAQADADADGIGDACDPTPLAPDLDGDGVPNRLDNCPFDSNSAQGDLDADGHGNTCDFCPTTANPEGVCPAALLTVQDLRTTVALGAAVAVEGVVTAVASTGFTMQQIGVVDGVNAGIFVFTSGAPGVLRGDVARVEGTLGEYFGELQLSGVDVALNGTTTEPAPVQLTVAQAAGEQYEGVLVQLTDAALTDAAYTCGLAAPGCTDTDLWELNGPSGVLVYDKCYEDVDWPAQVGQVPVTGVMTFRWERRRIMPRDGDDFGP